MDCEIYLATISPTIFSGDCRNIAVGKSLSSLVLLALANLYLFSIGPINATYRNYRHHLKLTELKSLIKSNNTLPADSNKSHNNNTNSHHHPFHDDPVNQWAKFCDVNACLDGGNKLLTSNALNTALSPTKLSMKKVFCDNLPVPSPATARIMPVDRFHVVTIPIKSEFLSFEVCLTQSFLSSFFIWSVLFSFFVVFSNRSSLGIHRIIEETTRIDGIN